MGLVIKVSPLGAELTSVLHNGKERLHQGTTVLDENGAVFWNRHSPILFPIVGKLKENQMQIEGKTYGMTQHGFARDMEFIPVIITKEIEQYELKSNTETLQKYPYHFALRITYEIIADSLKITYEVENQDEKEMLFGIGGHPAFQEAIQQGDYQIRFEAQEENIRFLHLENGLIAETEEAEYPSFYEKQILKLPKDVFKNDAIIMKQIKSKRVYLQKQNKTRLEFNFEGFPYLAIWSKPNAPFVCIEPWFSTADRINTNGDFRNKELIKIKPGESFMASYQIKFLEG